MSVVAVQDLKASTRLTAQNVMTQTLGKRTLREIQTERVKLGEHLGVSRQIGLYFLSVALNANAVQVLQGLLCVKNVCINTLII